MIDALFDFKYKWEVYTPKDQRVYGYYVLPIVYGDEFIGRIEPRFDKKTQTLVIHNIWLEKKTEGLEKAFHRALNDFKAFLGASSISVHPDSQTKSTICALKIPG
jgi:uncharacterized protein YcaQ